jgi:hypothetical protein
MYFTLENDAEDWDYHQQVKSLRLSSSGVLIDREETIALQQKFTRETHSLTQLLQSRMPLPTPTPNSSLLPHSSVLATSSTISSSSPSLSSTLSARNGSATAMARQTTPAMIPFIPTVGTDTSLPISLPVISDEVTTTSISSTIPSSTISTTPVISTKTLSDIPLSSSVPTSTQPSFASLEEGEKSVEDKMETSEETSPSTPSTNITEGASVEKVSSPALNSEERKAEDSVEKKRIVTEGEETNTKEEELSTTEGKETAEPMEVETEKEEKKKKKKNQEEEVEGEEEEAVDEEEGEGESKETEDQSSKSKGIVEINMKTEETLDDEKGSTLDQSGSGKDEGGLPLLSLSLPPSLSFLFLLLHLFSSHSFSLLS